MSDFDTEIKEEKKDKLPSRSPKKPAKVVEAAVGKIKRNKVLASRVKHNGTIYEKGAECPKNLIELFTEKNFLEEV
jgi:hypothetical protein